MGTKYNACYYGKDCKLTVDLAVCQKLVRSQNLSLPFPFIFTFGNNIKIHVLMQ